MEKGDLAKIVISALLFAFLIFLSTQIYTYRIKADEAEANYQSVAAKLQGAELDQGKLKSDLEYYSNPVNLEKEIKARFNYHAPGERTLILVPEGTTTGQ